MNLRKPATVAVALALVVGLSGCFTDPVTGQPCSEADAVAGLCHITPTTAPGNQLVVTVDGTVVENLVLVDTCLKITANRVRVRNVVLQDHGTNPCTLNGQTAAIVTPAGRTFAFGSGPGDSTFGVDGSGTIIEDVIVRQHSGNLSTYALAGSGYYLRDGSKVYGGSSVATCSGWCSLEDSEIRDKSAAPGAAFLWRGGTGQLHLRHTIFDPGGAPSTAAAVMFTAEQPTLDAVIVNGSSMVGSSSYPSFVGPIISGQTASQWNTAAGPHMDVNGNYFVDPPGVGPVGYDVQPDPNGRLWSSNVSCWPVAACNDPANTLPRTAPGPR